MIRERSHYELLGISPAASLDDITRKYRELTGQFNPDFIQAAAFGHRSFTEIRRAYQTLSNPTERARYDAALSAGRFRDTDDLSLAGIAWEAWDAIPG